MRKRSVTSTVSAVLLVAGLLSVAAASGSAATPGQVLPGAAVLAGQACAGTYDTDVPIPDGTTGTVASSITISGCPGNAVATSAVEVHITHTAIGDLVVNLVSPDGTWFLLHNRRGGLTNNINKTFAVNLAGKAANGTWKLRVQDALPGQAGFINSWTLNLVGGDFSMATSPTLGSVNPGSAVTTTVSTALITGVAQTINLTASGLPAGVTAAFSPSTITTGGSSTLTISTAGAVTSGAYPVTITGASVGTPTTRVTTYMLTVLDGR